MLQFGKYKMDTNQRINQLIAENEQLKLRLKNQDVMITANLGVSGQIKKAAFELGYHGSMEVDELDYLIETAKASVIVNQKNVDLTGQRDNAWQELREIREAINANPEESTADEVRRIMSQLVAVQDSVVHGKCANSEPCATFCEAIATRKMFKQLQVERDALAEWKNKIEFLAACAVVCEGKLSDKTMSEMMQISSAHDAEVAAKAVLEFSAKLLVNQKVDVIDCAKVEADQLRAKTGA